MKSKGYEDFHTNVMQAKMNTKPIILNGIPTCDTCRKARKELESRGLVVTFRDVRKNPLDQGKIDEFLEVFGEKLVNRSSKTWRDLSEVDRSQPAGDLLALYPTLMKRPVVEAGSRLYLGWTSKRADEIIQCATDD